MRASIAAVILAASACALGVQGATASKEELDRYGAQYKAAQAHWKRTHSAHDKSVLVSSGDRYATAMMTSTAMSARTRYPKALEIYQQVLKIDPANSEAKNNAGMIDSVYGSMIRSVRNKLKGNPNDAAAAAELARFKAIYRGIDRPMPG